MKALLNGEPCRHMKLIINTSVILIILVFFFNPSTARDTITPTQPLADNETLISSGGQFALGFFTPPNSKRRYIGIWFNKIADRRAVWVANRANPLINSTGLMSITASGTLMITDKKGSIIWSIDTTSGSNVSAAQLLDNGNFVLKQDSDTTQRYAWQSFDYPTDTLLAGMKLGLDRTTGLNRKLTAWKSDTDPSEGEYYEVMDINTNLYLYSRSGKIWRAAQWNGSYLRSIGLKFYYVNNSQEVTFSFPASDPPTKYMVSRLGKVQWLTWMSDSSQWAISLEEPATQCDIFGYCRPNGVCDVGNSPMCNCLQGFRPKIPSKWASANWTDGCTRKTNLDCRNETDGFVRITPASFPDSEVSFMYNDYTLEECRLLCLHNCSCIAYAMYAWVGGCAIWVTNGLLDIVQMDSFQNELYIRLASADIVSPTQFPENKNKVVIIVALLLSGSVLVIACVASFLWKRKRRNSATKLSNDKSNESNEDIDIPLLDFDTIEVATGYFKDENALGKGGFGTVYKGKLGNEQEIAVK